MVFQSPCCAGLHSMTWSGTRGYSYNFEYCRKIDSAYNAVITCSIGGGDTVVWTGEREIAAVERHTERLMWIEMRRL